MTPSLASSFSAAAIDPVSGPSTAPTTVVAPLVVKKPSFYEENKVSINYGIVIVAVILALWAAKSLWFKDKSAK